MLQTKRPCPTRTPAARCTGTLTEAVAQAGEHEGLWVEACFVCGHTALIDDQDDVQRRWDEHEAGLARRRRR